MLVHGLQQVVARAQAEGLLEERFVVLRRDNDDGGGVVAEAARRLRTDRPNLYRRMKRLGIIES